MSREYTKIKVLFVGPVRAARFFTVLNLIYARPRVLPCVFQVHDIL